MSHINVKIKKLSENAKIPTFGSASSAGLDLYASLPYVIEPLQRKLINTDLSMVIPTGWYGRIAPRSGLALKFGIDVMAGVIDSDYRGPIGVLLFNTSDKPFTIANGDRIAQMIYEKHYVPNFEFINEEEKKECVRGNGGFGSTGI